MIPRKYVYFYNVVEFVYRFYGCHFLLTYIVGLEEAWQEREQLIQISRRWQQEILSRVEPGSRYMGEQSYLLLNLLG